MTSLTHKGGGLIVKSGGLATSCSCCDSPPCVLCNGCDVNTGFMIDNDQDGDGRGYSRVAYVLGPSPDFISVPPFNIVWKTGYPAALACYFWFYTNNICTDGVDARSRARMWLFSCESGVLVNRTNDAVTSARFAADSADVSVTSTTWGYAIEDDLLGTDPGYPYCPTPAEDMAPLEPELIC